MKRFLVRKTAGLCLALASTAAMAQANSLPVRSGIWWNPVASAGGWNVEAQNGVVSVTHYTFDASGAPTFMTSIGVMDPVTRKVTTTLYAVADGSCVGCTYDPADAVALGTVTYHFTSNDTATVTYPNGQTVGMSPLVFGYPESPVEQLIGVWGSTWGQNGEYVGDMIEFSGLCAACDDADITVQGEMFDDPQHRLALATQLSAEGDDYVLLLDYSETHYTTYVFLRDLDNWYGLAMDFPKTQEEPDFDDAVPMVAARIKGLVQNDSLATDASGKQQRLTHGSAGTADRAGMSEAVVLPSGKTVLHSDLRARVNQLRADMQRQ